MSEKSTKKVPLSKQKRELKKLLQVWPNCPVRVMEQYIEMQFGHKPTRSVLQQAKEEMGLTEPDYEDGTQAKKSIVEYVVYNTILSRGLVALTQKECVSIGQAAVKERTGVSVQHNLLTFWVGNIFRELDEFAPNWMKLRDVVMDRLFELKKMGFTDDPKQRSLLQ